MKNAFINLIFIFFVVNANAQELLLFGKENHKKFLGCYNCSSYNSDSICNTYGTYGSSYSSDSIFNNYGTWGSSYSSSSPWNAYSSSNEVPVLVDRSGNFYGYFTINSYRSKASNLSSNLRDIYDDLDGDLDKIQEAICDGK